jgi:hypothetical protein
MAFQKIFYLFFYLDHKKYKNIGSSQNLMNTVYCGDIHVDMLIILAVIFMQEFGHNFSSLFDHIKLMNRS